MNIGDYVRIKNGIGKIIKCNSMYFILDTDKDNIAHDQDEIIKSSPNIIDLIEVGDYVNGKRVNFVYSPDGKQVFRIELDTDGLKGHMICESKHIKSIITKEQFENMEYKVGDK